MIAIASWRAATATVNAFQRQTVGIKAHMDAVDAVEAIPPVPLLCVVVAAERPAPK